eukprot:CAMPEP_0177187328 /NCGR_PEP_ID=MMETSP0367-20130122/19135_1 /TAXON_ID=447022 ORGANISM="Scrippsiella hangoei-like, Strain SHHI-4" /NCGR_SAMPLE_ID=MMETSP0367 /ASSEMBLY_ACC=CAM_ASM_000362 /LENGTH=163 /DNA_ID=CAMNT_0018634709 /DNA_START=464 /DNA_END=952 /DNA_ORIENTATION=-
MVLATPQFFIIGPPCLEAAHAILLPTVGGLHHAASAAPAEALHAYVHQQPKASQSEDNHGAASWSPGRISLCLVLVERPMGLANVIVDLSLGVGALVLAHVIPIRALCLVGRAEKAGGYGGLLATQVVRLHQRSLLLHHDRMHGACKHTPRRAAALKEGDRLT